MKTSILSATCAAITLGVTVAVLAQAPPSSSQPPPSPSSAAKAITVSGCVQKAQTAPTGTSGTAGAASSASEAKFILANASMSPSGTAGTSGSTPSSAMASEYRLEADDAKLTPHVGHKVEITGTVEPPKGASSTPPSASAANAPTLKVDNVKMVATTCP
jgi:hypothetical protein